MHKIFYLGEKCVKINRFALILLQNLPAIWGVECPCEIVSLSNPRGVIFFAMSYSLVQALVASWIKTSASMAIFLIISELQVSPRTTSLRPSRGGSTMSSYFNTVPQGKVNELPGSTSLARKCILYHAYIDIYIVNYSITKNKTYF